MNLRDALRASTLGTQQTRASELVKLPGGQSVEVRQPTVKQRAAILRAAGITDEKSLSDLGALQVTAVIKCSYVPGTQTLVFDASDKDALLECPAGGYVDQLAGVALRLMNVEAEAAAKNSVATPSGNSSSE